MNILIRILGFLVSIFRSKSPEEPGIITNWEQFAQGRRFWHDSDILPDTPDYPKDFIAGWRHEEVKSQPKAQFREALYIHGDT